MAEKRKLRLALVGGNGIPAMYGGTETFFEFLTEQLSDRYEITVYCSKTQKVKAKGIKEYKGAKLLYYPLKANGWQAILYDTITTWHAARHDDVILIFGVGGSFFSVPLLRLFNKRVKIIFNHGGLNEWEREKFSPFQKFILLQSRKNNRHTGLHVGDNDLYKQSLKDVCGIDDVHVIRYGGDQVFSVKPNAELLVKYPFLNEPYYVSVSRAQVDNNLHVVLEAFARMPDKKLVLVSNFKSCQYGRDLMEKYKDYPNIAMIPGIYDKTELNAVRCNALAYIHSHSRCGTPPSLCEAMNLGLPIISFNAEVNHEVTQEYALFFSNADDLVDVICNSSEEKLNTISVESTRVARTELTWKHIAEQYIELIEN